MTGDQPKPAVWVGASRKELRSLPPEVQDVFGYALYQAQTGSKHPDAKPLRGYRGAGVLEIVEDFDGDTYRAIYTVRFEGVIYVLHVFQKKSKQGNRTSSKHMDLVERRLKQAEELHKGTSHE